MTINLVRVREMLFYIPTTGQFLWLPRDGDIRWNRAYAWKEAGAIDSKGYRQLKIGKRIVLAHRLAWALMTNEWPKEEIDHKNTDKKDNRWTNLRCATRAQNKANAHLRRDNKSGYVGVSNSPTSGKFIATIVVKGKSTHLGTFKTAKAASEAYKTASRKHYGEFSIFNGVGHGA